MAKGDEKKASLSKALLPAGSQSSEGYGASSNGTAAAAVVDVKVDTKVNTKPRDLRIPAAHV